MENKLKQMLLADASKSEAKHLTLSVETTDAIRAFLRTNSATALDKLLATVLFMKKSEGWKLLNSWDFAETRKGLLGSHLQFLLSERAREGSYLQISDNTFCYTGGKHAGLHREFELAIFIPEAIYTEFFSCRSYFLRSLEAGRVRPLFRKHGAHVSDSVRLYDPRGRHAWRLRHRTCNKQGQRLRNEANERSWYAMNA